MEKVFSDNSYGLLPLWVLAMSQHGLLSFLSTRAFRLNHCIDWLNDCWEWVG